VPNLSKCASRLILALLLSSVVLDVSLADVAASPSPACVGVDARGLDSLFAGQVGRVVGADYVRPYVLPSGNTLMLMQDVFLSSSPSNVVTSLGRARFAHNAAVLLGRQGCVLRTLTGPRSYIGSNLTRNLSRWFWAMGGAIGADGQLHVMVAEFRNPNGTGAATGATPVGTWHATIDPTSLAVVSFVPAADASANLFGWAVASDRNFTYLYAHCYRQFIPGEMLGHDPSCANQIRLARVPLGHLELQPEYFTSGGWSADAHRAAPIDFAGQRTINPVSIQNINGTFVSVSKEGDWWGTTIFVDTAPAATGPWTTVASLVPPTKCGACNTYYASLMPWRQPDGSLVVALSNNAWDMRGVAYPKPWIYRNSFIAIAMPRVAPRIAGPGVIPPH
jgi:hypothetical protein